MGGIFNGIFLLAILGMGIIAWAHWVEPRWFHLRKEHLKVKKPLKKPLTILHLSDLHFTRPRKVMGKFFDQLSQIDTDFVFVTGDFFDHVSGIEPCLTNLKKLKPRKGIYAILGNHDYRVYPPVNQWIRMLSGGDHFYERPAEETGALKQALAEAGIKVLINENISVPVEEGEEVTIIGVDDPVSKRADLKKAFRGTGNGALRLTLVHSPVLFPSLAKWGTDVAFSGHTHGGHIRLPGMGPLPLAYKISPIIDTTHDYGFYGIVSRGMGAQDLVRLRFFCRPEAVLVRVEGS